MQMAIELAVPKRSLIAIRIGREEGSHGLFIYLFGLTLSITLNKRP